MYYIVNKDIFGFNEIDNEFVVFDSLNDRYHVMNESACDIINILIENEKCNEEQLVQKFLLIYDVDSKDIELVKKDINEIVQQFIEIGLVSEE